MTVATPLTETTTIHTRAHKKSNKAVDVLHSHIHHLVNSKPIRDMNKCTMQLMNVDKNPKNYITPYCYVNCTPLFWHPP